MGNRLRLLASKIKAALWKAVYSDKVRPFIWVYYIPLWCWGFYGTFFAGPPTYVNPVMGRMVYDGWVWLHLLAPSVVVIGLFIEDKAQEWHVRQTGIRLQAGGHACMFWVLLSYELSAITVAHWGEGTYSIFALAPYVVGCLLLAVQGVVKSLDGES